MTDHRVCNASPLVILAKIGYIELLAEPGWRISVPSAVAKEVLAGRADDPARRALEEGFGATVEVPVVPESVLSWGLGEGESAVIAFCLASPGATAVIDDAAARLCARAHGVPVIGTLGIVVRAARSKRIPAASPVVKAMLRAGLRVSDEIIRSAFDAALGESWNP